MDEAELECNEVTNACCNLMKSNVLPSVSLDHLVKEADEETWNSVAIPQKSGVSVILKRMFDQGVNPNLVVVINKRRFLCHSLLLKAVSSFFCHLDNACIIHLPTEKVSPRAFICLYTWALKDQICLHRDIIVELFRAAKFLNINSLIEDSWAAFEDKHNVEAEAALLFNEAKALNVFIKDLMFARIGKFFLTYVASREFQELDEIEVCNLLSRNTIGVNTEMEVFMSAVVWLTYDWPKRAEFLKNILECLRFSLLPVLFLLTLRKRKDSPVMEYLANSPELDELLQEGLIKNKQCVNQGHSCAEATETRYWIYDPECSYHHRFDCCQALYLTYDSFLDYLEKLQTVNANRWRNLLESNDKRINCCSMVNLSGEDPANENDINSSKLTIFVPTENA